jgi:hypothetical protein
MAATLQGKPAQELPTGRWIEEPPTQPMRERETPNTPATPPATSSTTPAKPPAGAPPKSGFSLSTIFNRPVPEPPAREPAR